MFHLVNLVSSKKHIQYLAIQSSCMNMTPILSLYDLSEVRWHPVTPEVT